MLVSLILYLLLFALDLLSIAGVSSEPTCNGMTTRTVLRTRTKTVTRFLQTRIVTKTVSITKIEPSWSRSKTTRKKPGAVTTTRRLVASSSSPTSPSPPLVPPSPLPSLLIKLEDLHYDGSVLLPQSAVGFSTGYNLGLLAVRKDAVSGKRYFYSDTHIYSNGAIYEFSAPSFSSSAPFPSASITSEFTPSQAYGNRRLDQSLKPFETVNTNGLLYDPTLNGLWWTYSETYSTGNKGAPTLGFSSVVTFPTNGSTASLVPSPNAPWKVHENIHWVRGGIAHIPPSFASTFGGRRLAVGFGGYYSIIGGGSWGPSLTLVKPSNASDAPRTVLGFPDDGGLRCPRPRDYFMWQNGSWLGTNPPVNGPGTWTGADSIGGDYFAGSGVWIETPSGLGAILFWSLQGTGRLAYENGGITSAGEANRIYIFDPAQVAASYRGERGLRIAPSFYADFPLPPSFQQGRIGGIAVDPDDPALIYVMQTRANQEGCCESFPVLHRYRIKRN